MHESERFYDLLFEVSNEHRHRILLLLQDNAMRTMELAKETDLNNPEIRRHISRLQEIDLIQRDVEGYYSLTPYGEASLKLFQEIKFISRNSDYFKTHRVTELPPQFLKQIGKLVSASRLSSPIEYVRQTQNLLKEAKEHAWMMVDQFPMNLLPTIVEAIDRGVRIRIIEPRDRVLEPDLSALTSEESKAYSRTRSTPLYEQRMLDDVPLQLYLSDSQSVMSFPNADGMYDYIGFASTEETALDWCNDLFNHHWTGSESRARVSEVTTLKRGKLETATGRIATVEGQNDSRIDPQTIQDAVDNYGEVVLKGTFNLGTSSISLKKSVKIRGEGRENGVPQAVIYKKGWSFPFRQFTGVFETDADDTDVTIENIHFTDFNCTSICVTGTNRCNSLKVLDNRVTVLTGYGRGITYASFGDFLHGFLIEGVGKGGVLVKGNHIDLAEGGIWRGATNRGGLEEDPEYRPELFNHEYFVGFGIAVNGCSGKVEIVNNVVRNASGRGIAVGAHESAEVIIRENVVESEVYGSYPFSSRESGAGILAETGLGEKNLPGFYVCIEKNTIKLEKLNYSGILVLGPVTEGSSKLYGGVIRDNVIQLQNGYEGIHVRKCDDFRIMGNKISGEAYYGIRLSGHRKFQDLDMSAMQNLLENNDLSDLHIKEPDEYSDNNADGKKFAGSPTESATAHVWLDKFSENNLIKIRLNEKVIDEGGENTIEYS
jgi:predicted transcriptional regulator